MTETYTVEAGVEVPWKVAKRIRDGVEYESVGEYIEEELVLDTDAVEMTSCTAYL